MSSPTTPARSTARSTLSTPSSVQQDVSPQELTPTSKIKAMLAAVDEDSEKGSPSNAKDYPRTPLVTVTGNKRKVSHLEDSVPGNTSSLRRNEVEKDGQKDDDEPLFAPRGRMAARLQGQADVRRDSGSSQERSPDENAYARIKREFIRREGLAVERKRHPSEQLRSPRLSTIGQRSPSMSLAKSRRSSPGLFLTPEGTPKSQRSPRKSDNSTDPGSDSPAYLPNNSRFLELVARKRAEREAKQVAEDQKRKEKINKRRSFAKELSKDASSVSGLSDEDRTADRRLTQQSRPTRKASKKALEEMNRETQRMSRNMQLAHEAKTKKKITKDSLLARFNFRTAVISNAGITPNPSSSTVVSSAPVSDLEGEVEKSSPPTSPVEHNGSTSSPLNRIHKNSMPSLVKNYAIEQDDELPNISDVIIQQKSCSNKGKGKAVVHVDPGSGSISKENKKAVFTQPAIKVRPPKASVRSEEIDLDSDDDCDVLPTKKPQSSRRDIFDRLPVSRAKEARSLQTLRALAHLNSPEKQKRGKRTIMSLADMQTSLQKRARQQAVEERAAKIEDLRSRGVVVQTAEERQQDQAEVEDLLEKARREGEEIMQKEKRAAKKAKIANGEVADLPDSSDEDEDYHGEPEDELEVDISGSEEGEEDDDPDNIDGSASDGEDSINEDHAEGGVSLQEDGSRYNDLIDDEASEDEECEQDQRSHADDGSKTEESPPEQRLQRSRRNKMVIVDDDDDDNDDLEEKTQTAPYNEAPTVEMPIFPAGSLHFGAAPMGLTQAFAATMADTQTQSYEDEEQQDSLSLLDAVPEPGFPMFNTYDEKDSLQMVEDSQNAPQLIETNASKDIELHFSQSQVWQDGAGDTQDHIVSATQLSEIPDPTQDVGFGLSLPAPERFVSEPPSTVDTVLVPGTAGDGSPIKKRGRLQRRVIIEHDLSDMDEDMVTGHTGKTDVNDSTNAFDAMRKARKAAKAAAAREAFDKNKSEAKGMVEEQAQESEDEYAGLGGASDEDSGEEDEDVNAMMDHGDVKVDERRLAQLYANKERASDEKAVEKLYKDINSGMLRRKRGADFDLSDSDDDREAIRRRKQREFAKMRKALLADENVNKIAEDPKKSAFLQTIEDHEYDDELDFLARPAEESFRADTGTQEEPDSQSQQPALPAPGPSKQRKPLQDSAPDRGNMRPPATARRTAAPKKPASLAEIRESVSFLIEEPGSIPLPDPSSSASEDENHHNDAPHRNPRRTPANPIIDRLSLKRAESTSSNANSTSRLAFHDPTTNPTIGGFKVPSLLRRATTSQLSANGEDKNGISTAVTERAAGGGEKGDFVRMGKGGKRSSVTFGGRERVGKGIVEGVERRRREERERVARERMARGGLGGLMGGVWE